MLWWGKKKRRKTPKPVHTQCPCSCPTHRDPIAVGFWCCRCVWQRCASIPLHPTASLCIPHPSASHIPLPGSAAPSKQRGISGPPSIHHLPSVEACPRLFVQILPSRMLFDVFKGAILMWRKEGELRSDKALRSQRSYFFTRKSASLGFQDKKRNKIHIFSFSQADIWVKNSQSWDTASPRGWGGRKGSEHMALCPGGKQSSAHRADTSGRSEPPCRQKHTVPVPKARRSLNKGTMYQGDPKTRGHQTQGSHTQQIPNQKTL